MGPREWWLVVSLAVGWQTGEAQEPALRTVRSEALPRLERLVNGGFEEGTATEARGWSDWRLGHTYDTAVARSGRRSAKCVATDPEQQRGPMQRIVLKQKRPQVVIASAWSRAEGVSGGADSGYSLYLDIIYTDGTPLWGQHAPFSTGTHDWERREVVVVPEKPIEHLTVYGLFRGHTGTVWFDDFSLVEVQLEEGVETLDDVPVLRPLRLPEGTTVPLADGTYGHWLVRDVATEGDFYAVPWPKGVIPALHLEVRGHREQRDEATEVTLEVRDTTGRDRALTLLFLWPLGEEGVWRWWQDVRRSEVAERGEHRFTATCNAGSNGRISYYPLACVTRGGPQPQGYCIAVRMDRPRLYRLAYHAGFRALYAAFDVGLAPDAKRPSTADVTALAYRFAPTWGFRAALKRYYDLFPEWFLKRVPDEGIWMPFTDISTVEGFEDFGFKFQEGAPNIPFDDQHGFLSFTYNEPMSYWMPMGDAPRTYEGILEVLRRNAADPKRGSHHQMAHAVFSCATYDPDGRYHVWIRNAPWCDGCVFALNPDPDLPPDGPGYRNRAYLGYDPARADQQYKPGTWEGKDGEYLDSLEMFADVLNFRREHFAYADLPLVFSHTDRKVAQMLVFATYEYARWVAEDVHRRGKLMFANAVPHRFSFLCHLLDVMGVERNWNPGGQYTPDPDWLFNYRRAMCYQKPYLLLQNTHFDPFGPELVERYFQRCLFYGVYPSMFSHNASSDPYWRNPKWYHRDRHLFRKYIPLIKRVATAGWEPIPYARVEPEGVYLERFGPNGRGEVFFALLNSTDEEQRARVEVEVEALGWRVLSAPMEELVTGQAVPVEEGRRFRLVLPPQATRVLRGKGLPLKAAILPLSPSVRSSRSSAVDCEPLSRGGDRR